MNLSMQLRAVRVYSFTSCLRLTDAVWVALLAARGFTLAQIGLAEAVFHFTSLLCEVPSGVAADLLGRRLNLAVSAVFEIFSDVTMAFSPNLAAVCAAMALKALACTMISGTLEALTYDSLKTTGRENEYLQAEDVYKRQLYLNPGSVSLPKENSPHSYLTLEGGKFLWKELDGTVYHELNI